MDIRLILVSTEGNAQQVYLKAIKSLGVQLDTVSTFKDLYSCLSKKAYNGVLVDLKTKLKAPREEKERTDAVLIQFPALQLKLGNEPGLIQTFYYGQTKGYGTLEKFVNEECRAFKARTIRLSPRLKRHFNVILSKMGDFLEKDIIRTVTVNVSEGGCFIYSIDNWEMNSNVKFALKELDDKNPIIGKVIWRILWGKIMQIPGIGLRFKDISEGQLKQMRENKYIS